MRLRSVALIALAGLIVLATGCEGVRMRMTMKEGHDLYKQQKYDEAIVKYKEILDMDPGNYLATYQIAMSNLAMYHPGSTHPKDTEYADQAISYLEKLMTMDAPDDDTKEKVVKYYLSLLASAEKSDKAIAFMEKELEKNPKDKESVLELANLYAKKGDFENAWKYFTRKAELDPNNKEAWYTLGVVAWERSYRGKEMVSDAERETLLIPKGLEAFDKALAIDPDYFDALVYTNLLYREKAAMLGRQGKLEEAQVAMQTADSYKEKATAVRKKQVEEEKQAERGA